MKLLPSLLAAATTLALASTAAASGTPITLVADGYGSLTGSFDGASNGQAFTFTANAGDTLDLLSVTSTYALRSIRPALVWSPYAQSNGFKVTAIKFDGVAVGINDPIAGAVLLSGGGRTRTINNFDNWSFSVANLNAGLHNIEVFGTAVASGTFSGTLTVTPVPEPETYAMMLAGLGALGFMARRRKSV